MKINITCGCGSSFQAPDHLLGQTVRCPACKSPLTVTAAPAPEPEVDLSDLTSLDQPSPDSSAHGSTVGRSAMGKSAMGGSRMRKAASDKSQSGDSAITQELDDRMTRMYEVYSGKKAAFAGAGSGGITKLLIGIGIAVITVGIAVAVGWNIIAKEYGDPIDSVGGMIAGAPAEGDNPEAPTKADRVQHPDVTEVWSRTESSTLSGVQLKATEIVLDAQDDSRLTFSVKVIPVSRASDKRLSMAASVALYWSDEADGKFVQADRVTVQGYDSDTGSLTFDLFDKDYASHDTNLMYYRIAGFDSDGKRLFDTPAARYSCTSMPAIADGRLTWTPKAADKPLPAVRIGARLEAPGWEEIQLWQINADGPIDQAMPDTPADLPVVVESSIYQPAGIELDAQGAGRWQMRWVNSELAGAAASGKQIVGIKPYIHSGRLNLRTVPGDQSFSEVAGSWVRNDRAGISRVMNFTPRNGRAQSATVATPPTLTHVVATPYDGRVHVSWDNASLLAGLDRYAGPLLIVVHRIDAQGSDTKIAQLPTSSTGYTDYGAPNGDEVSYEVSLVQANAGGAAPTVNASAWFDGHGELPVLIHFPVDTTTARVAPEPGLDRLFVSLGANELSYAGSGPASIAIRKRLTEMLEQAPGISVVDRAAMRWFTGAGAAARSSQPATSGLGRPAQVQIRLVDSTSPEGDRLSLWITDTATGESRPLATAPADEAAEQADVYINALKNDLAPRIRPDIAEASIQGEAPRLVVVGPIYPVQQAAVYHYADELTAQLAEAADQAVGETPIVTRNFWLRDTQQDPAAIDPSQLDGAVLVVGRAWNTDGPHPGVSLRAVDARTGQVVSRFESDSVSPAAVREFADWCASLKTLPSPDIADDSPMLLAEASLSPIHPVWRDNAPGASSPGGSGASILNGAGSEADAVVVSFGLPLPPALAAKYDITHRDPSDPLYMLRPYIASQCPLAFDDWTRAYADYIEADSAAFLAGFERISRIQQVNPGEFKPRLILRGEYKFIGDGVIPAGAGGLRVTPTGLNVRSFFPMGVAQQPMIDYREDLSNAFRANPWLMMHAWKQVTPAIADPFLRGELFGINDGRFERLTPLTKPAPFATYLTASLLAERGNREAHNYKQKALALASKAQADLNDRRGVRLTPEQAKWVADALLVLIFEKDPGTITQMSDDRFRKEYFKIDPEAQTDTLRLLVDRVGPVAWEWAGEFDAVDWPAFCWRSYEEMDAAIHSQAVTIPEADRHAISLAWAPTPEPASEEEFDIAAFPLNALDPQAN